MLFTGVATGRMNCEGGKKVALEDSGRVILSQQRESLAVKDKIDLLPGCATWEEETCSAVLLNYLFILTAQCVVRGKKTPILSQIMEIQRSFVCLIQWTCLRSLLMCVTKTPVVLVSRRCAMNYLPCLFLVCLLVLVGAFSKCFCFFIFALYCMFLKQ